MSESSLAAYVNANRSLLVNGWKLSEALANYNANTSSANKISSQENFLNKLKEFGYDTCITYRTVDGKRTRFIVVNLSEDEANSDDKEMLSDPEIVQSKLGWNPVLSQGSSDDDIYAALSLYIIRDRNWRRHSYGEDPADFHKNMREWITDHKISKLGMLREAEVIPKPNSQSISKYDPLRLFYEPFKTSFPSLKVFMWTQLSIDELEQHFKSIIEAIAPNHPEWYENYKESKENERKISEAAKAEEIKRREAEEQRLREREEELKREQTEAVAHFKSYWKDFYAQRDAEEAEKNREFEEKIKSLTTNCSDASLDELQERLDKLKELKPEWFITKDIEYGYNRKHDFFMTLIRNSMIFDTLSHVCLDVVDEDELKQKFSDDVKKLEAEILPEYKLIEKKAELAVKLYNDLVNSGVSDYNLIREQKHANGRFSVYNYSTFANDLQDGVLKESLEKYFKYSGLLHWIKTQDAYNWQELHDELIDSLKSEMLHIISVYKNYEKQGCKKLKMIAEKKKKKHDKEVKWAQEHDHWSFRIVDGDIMKFVEMTYDSDEHCMYYHPIDNDERILSKPFEISRLMREPESKWKKPGIIKAPQNSSAMDMANIFQMLQMMQRGGMSYMRNLLEGNSEPDIHEPTEAELLEQEMEEMKAKYKEKKAKLKQELNEMKSKQKK